MKPLRTYNKIGLLLVVVLLCSVSCKDFLSLSPQQSVSFDDYFATLDDFEAGAIGLYNQMQLPDWYGRYMLLVPDIMGEDVKQNSQANRAREWAEYLGSTETIHQCDEEFWAEIYEAIMMANQMIHAAFTPATAAAEEIYDHYVGEAYAVRALAHFDLVRLFAQHYTYTAGATHLGVPIVTTFDITAKPARNTVAEVYAQVIADFLMAIDLLSQDNGAGRFSVEACQALLSRVYLYMEDWANAEAMATAVINSGNYDLVDRADYLTMFYPGLSSEAILEVVNILTDRYAFDHLGYMYQQSGYGDYLPSKDLLNLIDDEDIRKETCILDEELAGIFGDYRVNKFPSEGDDNGTDNIPVIRLAEVYLNRAEARAQQGDDANAQADLNLIRQRAWPTAADVTLTGADLLDEILIERRIELCFEGHRLFDLTRYQQDLNRVDCTSTVCTVTYPDDHFILCIPLAEMDNNPNMVQNPGY